MKSNAKNEQSNFVNENNHLLEIEILLLRMKITNKKSNASK